MTRNAAGDRAPRDCEFVASDATQVCFLTAVAVSLLMQCPCADDDDGAGLGSVLKCRCLPLWCRLRRTKLEVLLILLLIGGYVYHQQQEASYIEQLETHEELTESYMQSASCELAIESTTLHSPAANAEFTVAQGAA